MWIVKPSDHDMDPDQEPQMVKSGDLIRLEHVGLVKYISSIRSTLHQKPAVGVGCLSIFELFYYKPTGWVNWPSIDQRLLSMDDNIIM